MITKYNWIKCRNCGHKLFKLEDGSGNAPVRLEIKCSSCKAVCTIELSQDASESIYGANVSLVGALQVKGEEEK